MQWIRDSNFQIGLMPAICLVVIFLTQIIGYCAIGTIIELCVRIVRILIFCEYEQSDDKLILCFEI